jgi:WD40 repeat protein
MEALQDVILPNCSGPIVIFIDEIDSIRSLPFSVDELFAAIRSCYNRRAEDTEFNRLTFCLLGVAAPSDLIQNPLITPFNVGQRIELTDFTLEEAAPLAEGLIHHPPSARDTETQREGRENIGADSIENRKPVLSEANGSKIENTDAHRLLARILYWTGGHPCLTQRLCHAVAESSDTAQPEEVDRICRQRFLSKGAERKEDNLVFVNDHLLKSGGDLAAILTLYRQIWSGKFLSEEETSLLQTTLKLSGVIKTEQGLLQVRNRIYRRVFDRAWISDNMPDAEKRRQQAAYRRGVLRAGGIFALFALIVGGLAIVALQQARYAGQARDETRRTLYAADMSVVQKAYDNGDYGQAAQILDAHQPKPGDKEDLRGFEWYYYWRLMHSDAHTFLHPGKSIVFSVAISPDGKTLASANYTGTIVLWDTHKHTEITTLNGHQEGVYALAFCPTQGNLLASGSEDKTVKLWDIAARCMVDSLSIGTSGNAVAFSPDGKNLATGSLDNGVLSVWKVATHRRVALYKNENDKIGAVAFSPDGRWLVAGYAISGKIRLLKAPFQHTVDLDLLAPAGAIYSTAFSPDSRTLAVGRQNGKTEIWDILSRRRTNVLRKHTNNVNGLAFSPDGKYLATGSWDNTVGLWDTATWKMVKRFIGHTNQVTSVAFSPGGKLLASGGNDQVKLWDPANREENPRRAIEFNGDLYYPINLTFSAGSNLLECELNRKTKELVLWNLDTHQRKSFGSSSNLGRVTALSPHDKSLAIGTDDGTVILWNIAAGVIRDSLQFDTRSGGQNVVAMALSPDGRTLAVESGDPALVTLWDVASRKQIGRFQHSNAAEGMAFSPDGSVLAVASWQGYVYLWDLTVSLMPRPRELPRFWAHAKPVTDVAFSPDSKTLATSSEDKTIKLWNVATQREMITLRSPAEYARHIAFSPDGKALASAGYHTVWVWQAASQLLPTDRANASKFTSASISNSHRPY